MGPDTERIRGAPVCSAVGTGLLSASLELRNHSRSRRALRCEIKSVPAGIRAGQAQDTEVHGTRAEL